MSDLLEADEPKLHVSTSQVRAMLRARYPAPEWALLEEVAPNTGGGTRYADALAVNLWSSRGHAVHGFEIKVSRNDWARELKNPAKADAMAAFCDHWWIVAPRGIVKDGELPPTWGLIEVRKSGLVAAVGAPKLEARPLTRGFFASLVRRSFESIDRMAEDKIAAARAGIEEEVRKRVEEGRRTAATEYADLKRKIAEFEEKTGLSFTHYEGPPARLVRLAKRLEMLTGYADDGALRQLTSIAGQLDLASKTIREAVESAGLAQTPKEPA